MKARFVIPLALFFVLVAFLAVGLQRDPRQVPSPLIEKAAPGFTLPQLILPEKTFSPADMKGKIWMLNVWASWCVACKVEHPVLMDLKKMNIVPIIGLDYKDKRPDALKFLAQGGDPYDVSVMDADGRVGIDWGVYGVPETFIVDQKGIIRYKHIGPITTESLQKTILPIIEKLKNQ